MPSWLYLLLEQTLIFYICFGVFARPGRKARRTAREEWERTHPYLKWDDWVKR